MGIVHFTTVGTSPGAVTSALAYLKKHYDEYCGDYGGGLVESVVLFCSHDVEKGRRPADEYVWNSYGQSGARQGWSKPHGGQNAIAVIKDFLRDDKHGMPLEGGHFYVWPLDVHDFDACLDAVAKATLAVARGDATGKYVWAHLTGGTNILNAAIMQAASFSGLIGRLFYAFVARPEDRKYLLPPSEDKSRYRLDKVPIIKTNFDVAYYRVLKLLESEENWRRDQDLLECLKNDDQVWQHFEKVDLAQFRRQYLNRMDGRELERERRGDEKLDGVRLSEEGRTILARIERPLFQALVRRGEQVADELVKECCSELETRRLELE